MENSQIANLLLIVLGFMIVILIILCIIFVILKTKTSQNKKNKNSRRMSSNIKEEKNNVKTYNKQSIESFMDFDNITDNMIIQNNNRRYLMVINCQGINFDLMSELEKNSVEQGFGQFLNTLRYPIQIYVQTRTVNLSKSIITYREKISEIGKTVNYKQAEYNKKVTSGQYTQHQLDKDKYELIRLKNLYEYGVDVVGNTERMSLNKNILSKYYYIIIPYYSEESPDEYYAKEEIVNLAFSDLYTRAQTIINSLAVCGIKSKILNSYELAELLYVAYNRDESETYDLERAMKAGVEDLYSTAPDVFDKKIKALDDKIKEEATIKANGIIYDIMQESEKQRIAREREEELDDLIDQMAKALIEENKEYLGSNIAEQAIEKIDELKEKGGEDNGKKKTRRESKSAK